MCVCMLVACVVLSSLTVDLEPLSYDFVVEIGRNGDVKTPKLFLNALMSP